MPIETHRNCCKCRLALRGQVEARDGSIQAQGIPTIPGQDKEEKPAKESEQEKSPNTRRNALRRRSNRLHPRRPGCRFSLTVVTRARVGSGRDWEERGNRSDLSGSLAVKVKKIGRLLEGAKEVAVLFQEGGGQVCSLWEGRMDRGVAETKGSGHFHPWGLKSKSTPVGSRVSFYQICTVLGYLSK